MDMPSVYYMHENCSPPGEQSNKSCSISQNSQKYNFLSSNFREKPKLVKPSKSNQDGPDAKKAKADPNETTMVKKVGAQLCTWSHSHLH